MRTLPIQTRVKSLLAICLLTLMLAPMAAAQERKRPQPKREKLPKEAKLLGAAPGLIKIQTEDGKLWLVGLGRNMQSVSVVGKAEASWLQPGMLVKFSARFNRKGEAIAPVEDLTVVTLREGMRFGLTPENLPTNVGGGVAGGLFNDAAEEAAKPKKPSRPVKRKPEDIAYTVVGKIAKMRKNELSIAAGTLLKIKLAEQPRINIDVSDISLAKAGSTIGLDAWYYPNMPGRAMATRVTVALERTLAGETKRRILPGQAPAGKANAETANAEKANEGEEGKPDEKEAGKADEKDPFGLNDK